MKIVAYYRVSTKRQGQSSLGLEAQQSAVQAFAKANGGKIVAEFTEIETGKRSDRPKLSEAIARTRGVRGTLVIAKLDRLARNVAFVSALMEAGCEFVACDNAHATRLTVHILAAVAEDEARRISERTTAALNAAKRRGTKLGTNRPGHRIDWRKGQRHGLAKAIQAAAASRQQARSDCYGFIADDIQAMRAAGLSFAAVAETLNAAGHVTTGGKAFAAMTVLRIVDQLATA
ncbi:MAG TPA: recombinase family protein [Pirellulales bacterium]|jgi:DNA invertase Pin-like site-specific DNA recombinase